jgi:hypothetical protein
MLTSIADPTEVIYSTYNADLITFRDQNLFSAKKPTIVI